MLDEVALQAIALTVRLAGTSTLVLLLAGTPLAWWLARTRSWLKGPVGALVALPLVLPPVVLGFYLLVLTGPQGPVGQLGAAAFQLCRAGRRLSVVFTAFRGAAAAKCF
jgi:molybdate transport system permease protein